MRLLYRVIVLTILLTAGIAGGSKADAVPDAIELAALHDLYTNLGGTSWHTRTNWPSGTWPASATSADFATWHGIQVVNGDVVGINLSNNNLTGTLPASIGNLTGLWSLYLNNNTIQGTIPVQLGNLTSLFYLVLSDNQLSGGLPATVSNLTALFQFNVNNNRLTGEIPSGFGNSSNLTGLGLANNQFSGAIPPSLMGLTNLTTLYLYGNALTGAIPSTINGLTNLVYLSLSDNQLSGVIPLGLGSLSRLVSLNLSNNMLEGSIPVSIGNALALQDVNLSGNRLSGTLPLSIANLTALSNFSVANNSLSGAIPAAIVTMPSLFYLLLQNNNFTYFPSMSAAANRGTIYIYLTDNPLGFGSLEANINASGQSVITHLSIGSIRTHAVTIVARANPGTPLVIPSHDPGQNSTVVWEKQETNGSWVNVNASNEDATQKTFRKAVSAESDGGRYRYSMRNSRIPAFLITSEPIYVGIGKDVAWNGQLGVSERDGILTKTAVAGWGNAGAHSENVLAAGQAGWVEFVVDNGSLGSNFLMGFSAVNTSYAVNSVLYGLEVLPTQRIAYHESGATATDLTGWVPGDVFRIARQGSSISYYKNGTLLRTTTGGTVAYEAKVLLNTGTSAVATSSFWIPASRGLVPDVWEFAALKDFYDSLGGPGWSNKAGWSATNSGAVNITAAQMDAWTGITVTAGDITGLTLLTNRLNGKIPESIGRLKALTTIDLRSNITISGSIPSGLTSLTNLAVLELYDNTLSGSIPADIGNLTNLTKLTLSRNNFSGTVPESIGNLTKLTWLSLYLNADLGGELPETFYNLVNLKNLYVYDTQIGGQLSEQIGNMSKLAVFWGYRNKWTGPLPSALGTITSLTDLYLYSNDFNGSIPTSWQNLTRLKNFWIHYNPNLTGDIPSWLGSFSDLQTLILTGNNMHGVLPPSLGNLSKLTDLYLSDLHLEGTIPETWQGLTALTLLQLHGNEKLTGTIPSWLVNNPTLTQMNFSGCSFTRFPDISSRPDKGSLFINIQGNRISVADIERYFTALNVHSFATFTYGPQRADITAGPIYVPRHSDLSIEAVPGGVHGVYLWERLVDGVWTDVSQTNQSTVAGKFVLSDVSLEVGGKYRYTVTNSWMADIRYESGAIDVTVTDAPVVGTQALYNGLISSVRWRTAGAYGATDGDFTGMYVFGYDDKYQIRDASWGTPNFTLNTFQAEGNRYRLAGMAYDPNGNILSLRRYDKQGAPKHNFSYQYAANTNKLTSVNGYVNAYTYNAIGQMVGEDKTDGGDQYVTYDVSGKVVAVYTDAAKQTPKVEYLYDDRGFRLAKINHADTVTTWYIRDASGNILSVYEQEGIASVTNSNLPVQTEIPVYGSGKLGLYYPRQDSSVNYELTDHLGNVRALLRDDINTFTATLEDNGEVDYRNPRVAEMAFFEHLFETEYEDAFMNHTPASAAVPSPKKVSYLFWNDNAGTTAAEKAVGPTIALRVNAGDKLDIETWTRFEQKETFAKDFGLAALSTLLGNSFVSHGGFEGFSAAQTVNNFESVLTAAAYPDNTDDGTRPYAYLNYIVYDENMVYKDAGWRRVPTDAGSNQADLHVAGHEPVRLAFEEPLTIAENGYIYVWVSNQSKEARVWFDDLTVRLSEQIVVQATDYGVWGDVLREQKSDERKYRFGYQGQFAEKDEETGWNHFELREYDAVVGRWTSTDPMGQYWSPYVGMGNDPINGVDPDGSYSWFWATWLNFWNGGTGVYESGGEYGYNTYKSIEVDGILQTEVSEYFGDERTWRFNDEDVLSKVAGTYWDENYNSLVLGNGIQPVYWETTFMPLPKGFGAFTGAAQASRSLAAMKALKTVSRMGAIVKQTSTKIDYLFNNRSDAMNWARQQLGNNTSKMYDIRGKWIGWGSSKGSVYWGHGDWGKGVGSSTFPHLNYNVGGVKGHLFLRDKITNRGVAGDFSKYFGL